MLWEHCTVRDWALVFKAITFGHRTKVLFSLRRTARVGSAHAPDWPLNLFMGYLVCLLCYGYPFKMYYYFFRVSVWRKNGLDFRSTNWLLIGSTGILDWVIDLYINSGLNYRLFVSIESVFYSAVDGFGHRSARLRWVLGLQ